MGSLVLNKNMEFLGVVSNFSGQKSENVGEFLVLYKGMSLDNFKEFKHSKHIHFFSVFWIVKVKRHDVVYETWSFFLILCILRV